MANKLNAKRTAIRFFDAWKHQDWPICLTYVQISWKHEVNTRSGLLNRLKTLFGKGEGAEDLLTNRLETHEISEIRDVQLLKSAGTSDVIQDVVASVKFGNGKTGKVQVRLVCEKGPYRPDTDGTWGVNPNSITPV